MTKYTLGRIFIWIGVLAWAPYFLLNYAVGTHVPVGPFLTVHLIGVLGGSLLSGRRWIRAGGQFVRSVLGQSETQ